jgi:hypothetical protein
MSEEIPQKKNNTAVPGRDLYPDLLLSAVWLAAGIGVLLTPELNTPLFRVILPFLLS